MRCFVLSPSRKTPPLTVLLLPGCCRAVESNGVRLTHYFAWSFTDNWEWREGFKTRFGVVRIDFANPQLPRGIKDSGRWLSEHVFKKSGQTKQ